MQSMKLYDHILTLLCSGYMPPEYALYGMFSVKSDVFSFGVLVLGIISGQKPISNNMVNKDDLLSFVSLSHEKHLNLILFVNLEPM